MPYQAIQTLIDPLWAKGIHAYFKATNLARLDDELIDRLCELHLEAPGPQCEIHVHQMGGAVGACRRGRDGVRRALDAVRAQRRHRLARSGRRGSRTREWARDVIEAAADASTGRAYVNFLGDADAARSRRTATRRTPRLVALKNEYDPTNVFRLNQNIEPQAA